MRAWGPLILLVVLAACRPGVSEKDTAPQEASGGPPTRLVLQGPVHHLDGLGREPMLVEHPDGSLFVSGYESQVRGTDPRLTPKLWKSADGGTTWVRVPVGTPEEGAAGNSDVDLAVGPDGTLYFVVMGFNRTTGEGTHVAMGVSHDVGATWSWTSLSEARFDDRPWVEVAPDGTAHAIWNNDEGVHHAVSTDRGRTWEERPRVSPKGGSSHLALGPAGEVAVRVTPLYASGNRFEEGLDLIAVSTDGGQSWRAHPAPGTREWPSGFADATKLPRWVEPLAWDADGALYHLWSEGQDLLLARSVDQGESWTRWVVAADEEVAFFPYLVARGSGELAATWFSGRGESLSAHAALIQVPRPEHDELRVLPSEPFQPDSWLESGDSPTRDPAGEYLPVAFLSGGGLGVVSPVQDAPGNRFGFTWWKLEVR
ncbi:MAG: glycoside hydrolase [Acidobacteria bacterium]|nr:glycoside hydrolase [Acidobacteriota bacterium]